MFPAMTAFAGVEIVIDARSLQDPDYADRGVGRHALNLLRHAPAEARLTALADPSLPPLPDEAARLFHRIRPNAYLPAGGRSCFVQPSPMTHDPLFAGRLLSDAGHLRAAAVYDFIPHQHPGRYLPTAAQRLRYDVALRWLARFDVFLPISQASAADLHAILAVDRARIAVTGAPLDPGFERAAGPEGPPPAPPAAHVLVIGGADDRKNVECAVRAHARCAALQSRRLPLALTGRYDQPTLAALRALAAAGGGDPALLRTRGHVSEAALLALYRDALCVVVPSRAEGFSLPVVEAMASGVPAVASDIPAHRELVHDPELRFDPDDDQALARILARIAVPERRARIVAAQAPVWPRFRAERVAARFWGAIGARLPASPAPLRGCRPRLALLSPLPPDRSGVADYTASTCAELGKRAELHLFTETENPPPVPGAASIAPMSALPHLSPRFDRVVSVAGNSHYHLAIVEQLLRHGGACIAHDSRMLGFYRLLLGADRACAVASRELGRTVPPAEIDAWLADEGKLEALLLGEIADAATPTILHSAVTARLFRERYGIEPALLPFSIYRPWRPEQLADRNAARNRLGLPAGEIVIATFGFVHQTKAPEECIWALELLRGWGIPASLHFVGDTSEDAYMRGLRALAKAIGVGGKVVFPGEYVSEQVYRDYLLGADLGVQLRVLGLGSLSGALLDCVAAGLPSVTNEGLAEALSAPGYVRRIPDKLSPLLLAEALAGLLAEGLAARRPEAERAAFAEEHSFHVYAERLCQALDLETTAGA